jgi:hypothetical protein
MPLLQKRAQVHFCYPIYLHVRITLMHLKIERWTNQFLVSFTLSDIRVHFFDRIFGRLQFLNFSLFVLKRFIFLSCVCRNSPISFLVLI